MGDRTLSVEQVEGVRKVVLSRPDRRNALNTALLQALSAELRSSNDDPQVSVVLLEAEGPSFCAGVDLSEFRGDRADAQGVARRSDLLLELQLLLDSLAVPLVAAVQGAAVGAGASLAVCADLSVMGESATLSFPEVSLGMVPTLMVAPVQRRTGWKLGFELLLCGRKIGSTEALDAGLANRVVPDSEVKAAAGALASALAKFDRGVLLDTKRLFHASADVPVAEALKSARGLGRQRAAGG